MFPVHSNSPDGKRLQHERISICAVGLKSTQHTMYHLIDSLLIVLAKIDHATDSLRESIAASTVEEAASRADDCSVNSPLSVVTNDRQIRVLSAHMESTASVSTTHCESAGTQEVRYSRGQGI